MKIALRKKIRCFYLLSIIITLIALAGCSSSGDGSGQTAQSFEIRGNDWLIDNGDTTPSQIDGTEFGPTAENGAETHTFILYNKTAKDIIISSIELTGDASFSTDASAITLTPGDESDISIVFTPVEATRNASTTVILEMSDGSYTFAIRGTTRSIWNEPRGWGESEEDQERWGRVHFDPDSVVRSNATEQDLKEIAEVAAGVWRDFNLMDLETYSKRVAPDIARFTGSATGYAVGLENVLEAMQEEFLDWERPVAWERPETPVISNTVTIDDFELWIDGDAAIAIYKANIFYGARWHGEYVLLSFQAFSRDDDGWKLAVQHDTRAIEMLKKGGHVFNFDGVYPVTNLERATEWYGNFLGEPEVSTSSRTTWSFDRARFHLDTTDLSGYAEIREGMPAGYVIFYTIEDIETERARLMARGVNVVTEVLDDWGPDPYFVALDNSGNPFVWMQRIAQNDPAGDIPGLTIENPGSIPADLFSEIETLLNDWLSTDAQSIGERMPADGLWCDSYAWSYGQGPDEVESTLEAMFETGSNNHVFDTTPNGLDVDMTVSLLNLKDLGAFALVTLDLVVTGRGIHVFQEEASAVLSYQKSGQEWGLFHVFIGPSDISHPGVWGLDSFGYSVGNLNEARDFYKNTMQFGSPYDDSGYYGYWSETTVFGIQPGRRKAKPDGKTNGYISFTVESVPETFDLLDSMGQAFPS